MSSSPHRPERTIPLVGASPGLPARGEGLARRRPRRASHFPTRGERLELVRCALVVARDALEIDPRRAAAEVRRAHEELREALWCSRDDLTELMILIEEELAALDRDLRPPPAAA